ncbi:TonB-dependent receptor [Echinimonas agarilytica]|uniref:TonB-dependent receptor n=1 Tax=Echinimonas agarilytica TaxID=1215918 RepID=A0AA41W731_9GAMM|nr:TonB-dependent receptor [Echinimonas agarilytica]MCM2680340.1 TonB-dependent receptor [Echinimonas agarilytica]
MNFSWTKTAVSVAVLSAITTTSLTVSAQEESVVNPSEVEAIEVKGFRSSLIKARDLKRSANGAQDSIVAEDIADFPDLNLADALNRIPGVAITREGGEGRQISLRGLGPDFTQVQLNGMEALGNSSSAMDSRGGTSRSRAFDFNIFAAELFSRVDVRKAFSADMDEGGIGGTVNLETAKPFDYDGFKGAVSGQVGHNSLADDLSPRVAALVSNTWDDFGALMSVAYSTRDINEQGYNTYRWRQKNASGSDISGLPQRTQELINNEELHFSRGSRNSIFLNDQERLGITTAFQYRPSQSLNLGLDVLYGELNNDRDEYHLQSRGSSSTALGCGGPAYAGDLTCSVVNEIRYNDKNEVMYSNFSNTSIHSESREQYADTEFKQVVANAEWQMNDDFAIRALVGHQSSDFETGSAKVYVETFGDLTIDYTNDRFYGTNSYGFDTTDIHQFKYHEIDLQETEINSSFDTASLDFEYVLNDSSYFTGGVIYKKFENETGQVDGKDLNKSEWSNGTFSDDIAEGVAFTNREHQKLAWTSVNVSDVLNTWAIVRNLESDPTKDEVEEETLSAFAQYNIDIEVPIGDLRGDIGVRYYDTEITSTGFLNDNQIDVSNDYSDFLPALNVVWDATDNLVVRGSASQNITRPSLGSMNATGNVVNDPDSPSGLNIQAGNPLLEPYESVNLDASLEYYFDEAGYAAISYFHKSIDNFILVETYDRPYGETGYPLAFLGANQNANTLYTVIQPQNVDDADISGIEVAFQRDLDFLPAPFDGFGVIANYTYSDGETLYRNVGGSGEDEYKSFPGLSDHSGNFTVYYETDTWGGRIASSYRSDYISTVQAGNQDEDERGFHSTTYVDFSAFYQVNDNLKLTLEGSNLTDEHEEQYSDSADRLYNTTENGRSYYVGLLYDF